ncbi:hypothetical protein CSB20_13905 [bacterium DOLZORAL124_64_63]|nr:MAG: hypothetical protein CSB20_13905 [bacterium DOLZORAL124_64_63]
MPAFHRPLLLSLLLLAATSALAAQKMTAQEMTVLEHQARLRLDTEAHSVRIVDSLRVPAGVDSLRLGAGLTVTAIHGPAGMVDPAAAVRAPTDEHGPHQVIDLAACGLGAAGGVLELHYQGTFFEPVGDVVFSRENVGHEITATIGEEGIYLSSAAGWLAWADDLMATHDIQADTPAGFESVTQGRRTRHEEKAGRLHTRWVADHPADGLNFLAARYHVHEEPVRDGIVSQTFLLEDDARLRATYMERTKAYIAMYEEMIGPYPYAKFATVENWFPTGYGMPGYTLLGSQVLRLPFIPYTSFGHEIAHNWWGNSVFVDIGEGNWCEGLTVYCADYHYKELESAEQARQYRRTLLKDYAAYTRDPAKDFPLNRFHSRHSGATRAVGYGKSMMVFHMIERRIGREAFLRGLRQVAADHRFTKAAWSDFFAAFEQASGEDLTTFQDQWLRRVGAPRLNLENVVFEDDQVSFELVQDAPAYDLRVPVVTTAGTGRDGLETVVRLDQLRQGFIVKMDGVREVAIDPDCRLFRRLHDEEIEPTMSRVLAEESPTLVLDEAPPAMAAAARRFAAEFTEKDDFPVVEDGNPPAGTGGTVRANLVINPGGDLLKGYTNADLMVSGETILLKGKRFSLKNVDLVFCARNPHDPNVSDLVVLSRSPQRLGGLARRLGHYGKYSYLVFPAGRGKVEKGNWEPGASPLVRRR